ncbi:MAG: RDD family protein [Deltaproteobacteria bacterium]|nr:RDD family protein [Deltaproteobacteria bacterium]
MIYAGFWRRLLAVLIDVSFVVILYKIIVAFEQPSIPLEVSILTVTYLSFSIFIVVLNAKYGISPGKLIARIRITKLDGSKISFKEAILRNSVDIFFSIILLISLLTTLFSLTDLQSYFTLSFDDRSVFLHSNTTLFSYILFYIQNLWYASELMVLLLNKKKRALHDFIAGTVVITNNQIGSKEEESSPRPVRSIIFASIYSLIAIPLISVSVPKEYYLSIEKTDKREEVLAKLKLAKAEYKSNENGLIIINFQSSSLHTFLEDQEWEKTSYEIQFQKESMNSIDWINEDGSIIEENLNELFILIH